MLLAFGSQTVGWPVEASIAAMWFLVCSPIAVNHPPAYTVEPLTSRLNTAEFAFGSHSVARPVPASRAAMKLLDCPPISEKLPPA